MGAHGGQMRIGPSTAAALTVAALLSGGAVLAAGTVQYSSTPVETPSLLASTPSSFTSDAPSAQDRPLDHLLLTARLSSVGSLDPIGAASDQWNDSDGAMFRAMALANSPYSLLTNGGSYFGSTTSLGDNVQAHFGAFGIAPNQSGFAVPGFSYMNQVEGRQAFDQLGQSESGVAGVDWDFAKWGSLGLVASQASEQNGLLSDANINAMAASKSANMSTVGMNARVGFGDGWVTTLSYNEGLTQLELRPSAIGAAPDSLHSRAYSFGVAKHGLFDENDSLGLALTRPLQVYSGGSDFSTDGIDPSFSSLKLTRPLSQLSSTTPETDFELGYVTQFLGGTVSLQANAQYQMNVSGLGGTNALAVISRAKINF